MATETFYVILESDLQNAGFTPAANGAFTSVGSSFTYTEAAMPYHTVVITDNGADQTTLSGDTDGVDTDGGPNVDNEGVDGETGTLYDPDGNVLGTPDEGMASDRRGVLEGSDGSIIEIYEIEMYDDIDMYAFSAPLQEGVTYTVVSSGTRDDPLPYSQLMCFAADTLLRTPEGEVPACRLKPGDLVTTLDRGARPVLWVASRYLNAEALARQPSHAPVRIAQGALGNRRDLIVSPQHRLIWPPGGSVLAKARHLAEEIGEDFAFAALADGVTYTHILLPEHALVFAEGALAETLYPGPQALSGLGAVHRRAICRALGVARPCDLPRAYGPPVRPFLPRGALRKLHKTGCNAAAAALGAILPQHFRRLPDDRNATGQRPVWQ